MSDSMLEPVLPINLENSVSYWLSTATAAATDNTRCFFLVRSLDFFVLVWASTYSFTRENVFQNLVYVLHTAAAAGEK